MEDSHGRPHTDPERAQLRDTNQGGAAGRTGKVRPSRETMFFKGTLPTKTVGDSRGTRNATANRSPGSTGKYGVTLCDWWQMATPSARDWRSGKSNQHGKNARPLNEQWTALTTGRLPTPKRRDQNEIEGASPSESDRRTPSLKWQAENHIGLAGKLAFLTLRSWMMGLPPSWLETALSIAPSAPPKATRSSPRSPTRSSEP
jgi:hypothetical protein